MSEKTGQRKIWPGFLNKYLCGQVVTVSWLVCVVLSRRRRTVVENMAARN